MEQLDLFATVPTEELVFETLRPVLVDTLRQNNAGEDNLDISKGKKFSSVYYLKYDTYDPNKPVKKLMLFRICCHDSQHSFGISDIYEKCIPTEFVDLNTTGVQADGYINFNFTPTYDGVAAFAPLLAAVLDEFIDSLPKVFDCCSRYEECSNCKQCIHPRPAMAISCGYRKVMKKGLIFYGKNRNIK